MLINKIFSIQEARDWSVDQSTGHLIYGPVRGPPDSRPPDLWNSPWTIWYRTT